MIQSSRIRGVLALEKLERMKEEAGKVEGRIKKRK
jgi:hypothetical protein